MFPCCLLHTTGPQPASSVDTTATSPKPAAEAEVGNIGSLPAPVLLHMPGVQMEPHSTAQHPMMADTAAATGAVSMSPMGPASSAAPAVTVGLPGPTTFLGLATCYELMLFAGACVEQLLGLYNQQLIPLMGMANAPVRELLVQWLAPVRQAISSSAQPLSVQQAAMQLLSRMVQLLLSFGSGGSSGGGTCHWAGACPPHLQGVKWCCVWWRACCALWRV